MCSRRFKSSSLCFILGVLLVTLTILPALAAEVPQQLPAPDGRPGHATKPVQVYILAGQSNMVGMGELTGAQCRYNRIFLTADPAAPTGPWAIYRVGLYRVRSHGVYVSADANAEKGAIASIYPGAYNPGTNYDKLTPAKTQQVELGVAQGKLPAVSGPHTVVVRGFIDVPGTGNYTIHPGHGDSSYNVAELDGREVYRKEPGSQPVVQKVRLEAGKRYALKITYFKGGSTSFWLSEEDLTGKGDLETVTKREGRFPYLIDTQGNWTVRQDVYYQDARIDFKGSPLSPTSNNGKTIGPEVGFGCVMGTFHDEQVLLIKTAMGNRALGFDFRPPSSGRTDPDNQWEALEYKLMVEGVRKILDDIENVVPGYKGQGYQIAGFVWWQGHKDSFDERLISEYEQNLVNLIKDVRAEFKVPDLPVAVATVGFGGYNMADKFRRIWEAQMAVADPQKHPEFAGSVATVDTRPFWLEPDDSPAAQDYHYNRNAATYMLVGEALGRAMVKLRGGQAAALPYVSQREPEPPRPSTAPAETAEPTAEEKAAAQAAMRPIVLDAVVPAFVAQYHDALLAAAKAERPARVSQFLVDDMERLADIYRTVGIHDYDWQVFGPDLRNVEWHYFSFDPPEALPKEKEPRYRKVTFPKGMENWFAPEFDPARAGWKKGLPPFGQLGGKLAPLRDSCGLSICGCSQTPRTLWEKEVLLIRGTFDLPPLKPDHRYRILIGGSAHVNAGEGFAIYVNGKPVAESPAGVGKRQGAQPRGTFVYSDLRDEFNGGKVTIAVISFLRYSTPRGPIPPSGHLTVWIEEAKSPPVE